MQGMDRARRSRPPRGTYTELPDLDNCNTSDDSSFEDDELTTGGGDVDTSTDRSKQNDQSLGQVSLLLLLEVLFDLQHFDFSFFKCILCCFCRCNKTDWNAVDADYFDATEPPELVDNDSSDDNCDTSDESSDQDDVFVLDDTEAVGDRYNALLIANLYIYFAQ